MGRRGATDARRIADAISDLYATYKPEGVGIWLQGAKVSLNGESPLGLLHQGRVDDFCAAVERLEGGFDG